MTAAKIVVNNDFSFITEAIPGLHQKLWKALRKRAKDYFFHPLYRQKKWDGFIDFYGKTTGRFMTGLLPEVEAALGVWEVPYELDDQRPPMHFRQQTIDENFFNCFLPQSGLWPDGSEAKPITPRDYQIDLTAKAIMLHRGIIQAPTRAGKSLMMVGLAHCLPPNTPMLFTTKQSSLVLQIYEDLVKWGVPNVGMVGGGKNKPDVITCCTLDSLHKLERLFPFIRVLIVDECHKMMTKKAKACYRACKKANVRLAFSATPFKFSERDPDNPKPTEGDQVQKFMLKGFFGPIILTSTTESGLLTTKELQERGILSKSNCTFYKIKEPKLPYALYADAVNQGMVESHHFHQVVRSLVKTLKGRTLILVQRVPHGEILSKMIPGSIWVSGKDTLKNRKQVIKMLCESESAVAIATQQIFNDGITVKIHNLINAAGGKASHDITQRLGRGLGTADDKDSLEYYDWKFDGVNPYLDDHSDDRIRIIGNEGHNVTVKEIDFPVA